MKSSCEKVANIAISKLKFKYHQYLKLQNQHFWWMVIESIDGATDRSNGIMTNSNLSFAVYQLEYQCPLNSSGSSVYTLYPNPFWSGQDDRTVTSSLGGLTWEVLDSFRIP